MSSKFVSKYKASYEFLASTKSNQLKTYQICLLLIGKLALYYHCGATYETFAHHVNLS
jgi:hypothetical protein